MEFGSSCSIRQPVEYKGVRLDCGYRVDLLIEDKLIIELKSVEQIKGILPQGHPRGTVADLHEAGGSEDRTPDELQCHQA